jgi:peptidoglycan hydrolase-like protein with peptidoglycan-binding domain
MSYLLVVLTFIASFGMGSPAIARESLKSQGERLVAQAPSTTDEPVNPETPPPSPAIQSLQNRLAQLGYYEGLQDGVFDQSTRDALAAFQRDSGLVGTGMLDPLTQERLRNPDAPAPTPGSPNEAGPDEAFQPGVPEAADSALGDGATGETMANDSPEIATGSEDTATLEAGDGNEDNSEAVAPDGAETDEAPQQPPADAAARVVESGRDRRLLRLALLGLVVLGIGGLGAALLLRLAHRQPSESEPETEPVMQNGVGPVPNSTPERPAGELPRKASNKSLQNGSHRLASNATGAPINIQHQALPITSPVEPRVAKVNIIEELIRDLDNPDPGIRRKTIWELGQRGNSAAVQPLVGLLMEADSQEQSLILAALAEINMKTLKPLNRALAMALQDPNPEVRKNAIRDLTRVYDSMGQAGRILGQATIDSDPEVRQTAHWALEQLQSLRLSATESAALPPDKATSVDRLPEDGSSSRTLS